MTPPSTAWLVKKTRCAPLSFGVSVTAPRLIRWALNQSNAWQPVFDSTFVLVLFWVGSLTNRPLDPLTHTNFRGWCMPKNGMGPRRSSNHPFPRDMLVSGSVVRRGFCKSENVTTMWFQLSTTQLKNAVLDLKNIPNTACIYLWMICFFSTTQF